MPILARTESKPNFNSASGLESDSEAQDLKPESSDDGEDLSGITALEEGVNQLLQGEPEIDSELVTTSGSTDITSIWYHGHYPFHRRPSLCVSGLEKKRKR